MKILKNAGKSKILATWPSEETNTCAQMAMEKAGRVCYQSERHPITAESAKKFVGNVHNRTHYSVLEHGWRGYVIDNTSTKPINFYRHFWPITKYLYITERPGQILISANLETWRKAHRHNLLADKIFDGIRHDLGAFCPAIFPGVVFDNPTDYFFQANPISIEDLHTKEEQLNHIAHTTLYDDCSRGLTHEGVRHRPPVFSQESTRYVDESDFCVVVPPHRDEHEIIKTEGDSPVALSPEAFLRFNEAFYQALRKAGWKPEDARQILPTAIKSQIAMSCNLLERRYIYYRRTSEFAHWEIRKVMCDELRRFQALYPNLFDMFEYVDELAKDNVRGFCRVTEEARFFCD